MEMKSQNIHHYTCALFKPGRSYTKNNSFQVIRIIGDPNFSFSTFLDLNFNEQPLE